MRGRGSCGHNQESRLIWILKAARFPFLLHSSCHFYSCLRKKGKPKWLLLLILKRLKFAEACSPDLVHSSDIFFKREHQGSDYSKNIR